MKVVAVGGVAGGASCAARLRRLDENAEIIMAERGPYVSYANCDLPYHVGGVIPKQSSLIVASAPIFKSAFNIDVRTNCEAVSIAPKLKVVELRNVQTGEVTAESVPGAVNIPMGQLRSRLNELPRDREIHVICRSAQRAYYATRVLLQNGFNAKNISGGMLARAMFKLGAKEQELTTA